jgi:hypothetical protein
VRCAERAGVRDECRHVRRRITAVTGLLDQHAESISLVQCGLARA